MRYAVKPSNEDIDNQLNTANAWEEKGGSATPGMTYEQGVKAGIEWVIGDKEEMPIEEEPEEE